MAAQHTEVTTELNATQYVILAENQRKKKALADSKTALARIGDENALLLRQLEDTQRENYEVTEHLRQQLLGKTERVAELEAELVKQGHDKDDHARAAAAAAAAEQRRLLEEAASRYKLLQTQYDDLKSEFDSVIDFKHRQVEVEDELLRLREENQTLQENLQQQRVELERYYLELNTKMRKEYEQRLEELKKSAEEEIDERLDAAVKRILAQNRRMADELRIHVQETEVLQQEVKILEEDRSRLLREVGLKTELEAGYAQRGAKQATSIKEAQAKIAGLEASLQQIMADFDRERQSQARAHASSLSDAQAESEALRRLVKLKTRELKNVRRLAQEVLLQRSDVETFLLSSLHTVRREIERDAVLGTGTAGTLDEGAALGQAGQLDIKDLSWSDRERVLRLLFAKINNQAQQIYFSNLPPHPLDAAVAGVGVAGGMLHGAVTDAGPAGLV